MEREPGVVHEQEEPEKKQRRSQRPPKPLTHRIDPKKLQELYQANGLHRPELTKRPTARDKIHATGQPPKRPKETTRMDPHIGPQPGTKPGVGGTQQQHSAQFQGVVNTGEKALIYGGAAYAVGTLLMITWKGVTRWLG